jgi:hypothetical protein
METISLQIETRRPVRFDDTAYLNRSGAETANF